MNDVTISTLVSVVRALSEAAFERPSPFHLGACGMCKAPTFQYPCPNCRAWCDYGDSKEVRARDMAAAEKSGVGSREAFVARVDAAGGIGPWYFTNFRKNLAYSDGINSGGSKYTRSVESVIERARGVTWPSAGEIWDTVTKSRMSLPDSDYWQQARDHFEMRAIEEFGAERLIDLKVSRTQFSWPENCREGKAFLSKVAEETLASLSVLDTDAKMSPKR